MATVYKIHPAIGIARLGNSPEFFVGPERLDERPSPPGGFKDAQCRVKRQAARFRIFAHHDDNTVEEIADVEADITWTVHLANKKAAYPGRGNSESAGDLTIDPGARATTGPNQQKLFDTGAIRFSGQPVTTVALGEMRSDRVRRPFGWRQVDALSLQDLDHRKGARAGISGFEFNSAYAAAKFGVEGWMESLQPEVAPFGITTTIVNPGFFRTDLLTQESTTYAAPSIADYADRHAERVQWFESMNRRQAGDPTKLARALVEIANQKQPPRRFIGGADAIGIAEQKARELLEQANAFRELWTSLAREDA